MKTLGISRIEKKLPEHRHKRNENHANAHKKSFREVLIQVGKEHGIDMEGLFDGKSD